MGQQITVTPKVIDDVVVYDTNRSITGQDGDAYVRGVEADDEFGSQLAVRIFDADEAVDHVFVASNQVVVRRPDGWTDAERDSVAEVIANFFVYYDGTREVVVPE